MLTKLKCFFGWHEWEYSDQDEIYNGIVPKKRKCKQCQKHQKECFIRTHASYQIRTTWRNALPDKPTPPPKRPSSKLPEVNVDTPMPECKEPRKSWRDSADECDKIAQPIIGYLNAEKKFKEENKFLIEMIDNMWSMMYLRKRESDAGEYKKVEAKHNENWIEFTEIKTRINND